MAEILIIDDDKTLCALLIRKLTKFGHSVVSAHSLHSAIEMAERGNFDIILLDVGLPDGNGLDMLPQFQEMPNWPEVIIVTGNAAISGAKAAIETGAWDYIQKGSSLDEITLPIMRALDYRREKDARPKHVALKRKHIIGDSPLLMACLDKVAEVCDSDMPVMITGESGTGKELLALAIHENSNRYQNRFIVLDCAALPENLAESILFGFEAGAYTGANKRKAGLISQAHGGTLFLDEIGELPRKIQSSFLRVLQEKRFRRIGGSEEEYCDFRVLAATNRDLEQMIQEERFRQDLHFRLNQFNINLPPLRDRGSDLQTLAHFKIKECAQRQGCESKGVSPEFIDTLLNYPWPGNVRELFGAVEQAVINASDSPTLFAIHLPSRIRLAAKIDAFRNRSETESAIEKDRDEPLPSFPGFKQARNESIVEFEKRYLQELIQRAQGGIQEACRIAGVSTPYLYSLLRRYSLKI